MKRVLPLALVVLAAGCDPSFSLRGKVTRCDDDDPIVGVLVQMYYGDVVREGHDAAEAYTSPQGMFDLGDIGTGDKALILRFIKPGYRFEERHLSRATKALIEQCLQPGDFTPDGDAGAEVDDDAGGM
jgi:hypothetical protein